MLLIFHLSESHVMTSCNDVTKPDLPISARRCARKLILFFVFMVFHVTEFKYVIFFNYFDVLMS